MAVVPHRQGVTEAELTGNGYHTPRQQAAPCAQSPRCPEVDVEGAATRLVADPRLARGALLARYEQRAVLGSGGYSQQAGATPAEHDGGDTGIGGDLGGPELGSDPSGAEAPGRRRSSADAQLPNAADVVDDGDVARC